MSAPLRLATFAVPLSGNKGSASMLLGLRDAFAAAGIDAHFSVFSYYCQRDREAAERLGNVAVHPGHPKDILFKLLPLILLDRAAPSWVPSRWRRAVDALRQCDGVLLVGGTTFADSMLYKVPWNVLAALPGYWMRKPTIFLSQTLGPFRRRLNRMAARWTLRRALEVHARGRQSADHARRLGIGQSLYRPDLSFSMTVPDFDQVAARHEAVGRVRRLLRESGRRAVGMTPNSIVYQKARKSGRDYVGFLAKAVAAVDQEGYLPVLIPHSYRPQTGGLHNNDRRLCLAVLDRLPAGLSCEYVDADLGAGPLRAVIGQLHLLLASRFHSMISALATGVPPITYGWGDQKYREVLAEFGVEDLYVPYREIDAGGFPSKFRDACRRRDELSQRVRAALVRVRSQSDQIADRIVALLRRNASRPDVCGICREEGPAATCQSDRGPGSPPLPAESRSSQ